MKKIILACVMMFSLVQAEDTMVYIGLGFTNGSGEDTHTLSDGFVWGSTGTSELIETFDVSSVPLKFGVLIENNNRLELTYSSLQLQYSNSEESVSAFDFDYLLVYELESNSDTEPYWTVGFGSLSLDNSSYLFTTNEDLKGFSFNFGLGVIYKIEEQFELELAYKLRSILWQEIQLGVPTPTMTTNTSTSSVYLGVNFKF